MPAEEPWLRDEEDDPDYYELLAVERTDPSFEAEVKSKYSHFAQMYHPDHHVGASAERKAYYARMFKRGTDAKDVLLNPESRARYDRWLNARSQARARGDASSSSQSAGAHSSSSSDSERRQYSPPPPPPPPPHLATEPGMLDFDTIPAGQPARITLRIWNAGGPCQHDLFRIRGPRHPSHPHHDPQHWLTISDPTPWPSPSRGPISVQCEATRTRLTPGQTNTTIVHIDFCGDHREVPARITAAPRSSGRTVAAVAGGVLALLLVLFFLARAASSPSPPSTPVRQQSNVAQAAAPAPPAPPAPPPPAPTSSEARLIVAATAGGNPVKDIPVHVWTGTTNALGKPLQGNLDFGGGTDTSGVYDHAISPGEYVIEVDVEGYGWGDFDDGRSPVSDKTFVTIGPGERKQVNVALGTLQLSMFKASGAASANDGILVFTQKTDVAGRPVKDRQISFTPHGDATGLLQVNLAPGAYILDHFGDATLNVTLQAGQVTAARFVSPR